MSTLEDDVAALERNGFTCEDKRPERDYFVVQCNVCHARWSLGVRTGTAHAGNVLTMLNHASKHGKWRIA